MSVIFNPTAEETRALEALIAEITQHSGQAGRQPPQLTRPDRGAHQQQLAGGKVLLTLERSLPPALDGLGVFEHDGLCRSALRWHRQDVDRPRVPACGDRSGFPGADGRVPGKVGPADRLRHDQRSHLADRYARGVHRAAPGNRGCRGCPGPARQPGEAAAEPRAARRDQGRADCHARHGSDAPDGPFQQRLSSSTGPASSARATRSASSPSCRRPAGAGAQGRGPKQFTDDWRARTAAGPLTFELHWIPFLNERETPLDDLTTAWRDQHKVRVGTVVFPQVNAETRESKLIALLASELGANPGNWQETTDAAAGTASVHTVHRSTVPCLPPEPAASTGPARRELSLVLRERRGQRGARGRR